MAVQSKNGILWLFTGVMVLIFAAACGHDLSGAATAVAAKAGVRENIIAGIAVVTLLAGFALTIVAGLRDLTGLARREVTTRRTRCHVRGRTVLEPVRGSCARAYQRFRFGANALRQRSLRSRPDIGPASRRRCAYAARSNPSAISPGRRSRPEVGTNCRANHM